MDNEDNNTANQVCNVIGSPWIICGSKSYAGRVYYFNTVTGNAVWNLSDVEMEKANSQTKSLQGQSGVNITECPEPKDPPVCNDNSKISREHHVHKSCSSNIFNKQIINNQFTNQALQSSSSDMCAAGQSKKYFFIPAIALPQLENPTELSVNENIEPKVFVQNSSRTLSNRFQNLNVNQRTLSKTHFPESNRFTPCFSNENFVQMPSNKNDNPFGISDLRQKLTAKRKFSGRRHHQIEDPEIQFLNTFDDQHQKNCSEGGSDKYNSKLESYSNCDSVYKNKQDDGNCSESGSVHSRREHEKGHYTSDADSDWLEDNLEFRGTKLNLDVTNLKKLAKPNTNPDRWYIATDKNILICHLNLFNMLINSDDQCHVMVSRKVMAELHEAGGTGATRRRKNRAKRATAFLSQHLDAGRAIIGECLSDPEEAHYLLKCCIKVAEQNYHVILLSNDVAMQKVKDITYIPIFNVKEIKLFLASDDQDTDDPEPSPRLTKINITIPNSLHLSESNVKSRSYQETQPDNEFVSNESMEECQSQTNTVSDSKQCTMEIGVQTELTSSPLTKSTMDTNVKHTNNNEETHLNSDKSQDTQFSEDNIPSCVPQIKNLNNTCRSYTTHQQVTTGTTGEFQETQTTWDNNVRQTPIEKLSYNTTDGIGTHLQILSKVSINPSLTFVKPSDQSQNTQLKKSDNVGMDIQVLKNPNASKGIINTQAKISDITQDAGSTVGISAVQMSEIEKTNDNTLRVETRLQGSEETQITAPKTPKKREIRLKRNISNQALGKTTTDKKDEIKQFKWRRKRTASNTRTDELKSNETDCLNKGVPTSLFKYSAPPDDNSEKSSSICLQRSARENLIIEETSTSGAVSNTSAFDSESDIVNIHKSNNIGYVNESIDRNLIFEVTNRNMEDNLRIRYEEWFSRFVQIMEEVMTQVLVQNPNIVYDRISPPWTMFEATECIKAQFANNADVVKAATGLSNLDVKLSCNAGKPRILEPHEFMVMYSYGVYLIDSLQAVLKNCEDVLIASDSLSKLFKDIQNPSLNCSTNELFDDNRHERSTDAVDISNIQNEDYFFYNTNITCPTHKETGTTHIEKHCDKKLGSYDLRSKKRTQKVKSVTKIDIKSTFFNCLELQNRSQKGNENVSISSQDGSKNKPLSPNEQNDIRNLFAGNLNFTDTNMESDLKICDSKGEYTEPKIVSNINNFPEFKSKLNHGFQGPYENNDNENISKDEYYVNLEDVRDFEISPYNVNENTNASSPLASKSDRNFDLFFQTFVDEIKTTFLQVKTFCSTVAEEMRCSGYSSHKVYEMAEKAHMCIGNINNHLKSILYRETHDPDNNMQSLLVRAGFDIHINDKQCVAYRDVVAKCSGQAEILLDALKIIMDATAAANISSFKKK